MTPTAIPPLERPAHHGADRVTTTCLAGAALVAGSVTLWVLVFVLREAAPALGEIGLVRLLSDPSWNPTAGAQATFGLGPMLVASIAVTVGATLIAAPLGTASAVFSTFYAPRPVAAVHRRIVELLAGIPSVVFGLWGLVVLVPLLNQIAPPGQSLLAGILVLTLMILPTVALTAEGALRLVPPEHLRTAAALGLDRTATVRFVALPAARPGILVGIVLAAARAIGETMAVVMVCGNVVALPSSPFDPVRTVTANIVLEMGYATASHRSVLFASGLALIATTAATLALAAWMHPREVA